MSFRHRLLPVAAILFGLAACGSSPSAPPPAAARPSAAPAVSSAASTAPAATSAAPATKAPASRPSATKPADRTGGGVGCPTAKALEKLVDLPKDWHFVPSEVRCWKGWATAAVEGPNTGDGVYLFRHHTGSGWRYHSQGSGYSCKDLGINEPAPFCQYPG